MSSEKLMWTKIHKLNLSLLKETCFAHRVQFRSSMHFSKFDISGKSCVGLRYFIRYAVVAGVRAAAAVPLGVAALADVAFGLLRPVSRHVNVCASV